MKKKTMWLIAVIVLVCIAAFIVVSFWGKDKEVDESEPVATTEDITEATTEKTDEETSAKETSMEEITTDEETTTQEAKEDKKESGLEATISYASSWEVNDETFVQIDVTIKNNSKQKVENWNMLFNLSNEVTLSNGWNGEFEINKNKVKVAPASYNAIIEAGSEVTYGLIVSAKGENEVLTYSINGAKGVQVKEESNQNDSSEENTTKESQSQKPTESTTEESKAQKPDNNDNKDTDNSTPVSKYGKLSVKDTNLVSENGEIVQLKGASTHGINWFPQYVTKDTFKTLRDKWDVDLIRLAMYTAEYNGYCAGGNQDDLKNLVHDGVKYATELDMYVIIDWHILSDGNPQTNKEAAIAFFKEMSKKYKDYSNVIYEICNEPNGNVSWENDIKPYAQEVIKAIRKNDSDAVIIVGTPTWSQDVDIVAQSPLPKSCGNIMYALHFYAATHKDDLQNKLRTAINAGLPIFVSEFGICEASGNGYVDTDSANKWISLLGEYDISYVGWNISNKDETSSIINPSSQKVSGWSNDELTKSGKWFKQVK